ncbi:hypothetical protein EV196_11314 [Mariniflexile fucanivorans]|uniref:Lipocalin-like protein n=1 Tax=Mariniflexile fucanivorans TaxID=264023 RepID=A0A4R1R9R8_9FLAO|nr:hypothetical protein [Mariniflexile fucanivorans]TCL62473.1 hypothetical protein EV196_11314 [Mariniflexile fucanivorans]
MKNIVYSIVFLITLSCCDDDNISSSNNGFLTLETNKNFLLDEKWFLDSMTSKSPIDINNDGVTSTDLMIQVPECDLDSYYVFEANQSNVVVLFEGTNVCSDNFAKYGSSVWSFSVLTDQNKIMFETLGDNLLGGLKNPSSVNQINSFDNVNFLISNDSSYKLIKSEIQIINKDNNVIIVEYVLRADINNRP